ncbi:alpha/beta hydrolase family esterase [Paracidovorax sp. MALMAid1276]|uniref:extracellular catalytic domain type 1 short-chain-length polyhydroxyalkanoate depolymerase n=1 Tax=Paracidovorax sp. MALMAid1276 TaxID=3411631 RepID=UPI003B9B2AB0
MPRRKPAFSLLALTRAYQRNLRALARATRAAPLARVKQKPPAAAPRTVAARGTAAAARAPASRGLWKSGVAPGPAGARRFHLYLPPGPPLRPGQTLPLLVMLHGCDQTGRDLADLSRMQRLAARERFLVLYPEQERLANAHGCWNWFERRSGKADAEAATLLAAVDLVARRHPVDLGRVAVAGLSAGASMAALMAARYPHRFCAVAMHSGVAPGAADSAATALAAMHGRRDAHLPEPAGVPGAPGAAAAAALQGGAGLGAPLAPLAAGGAALARHLPPLLVVHGDADRVVSLRNAETTAQAWAQALGARPGAPRVVRRGQRHATRVTEYRTRGRAVVVLREVQGLGHAWSGGTARKPYSDPDGPDASALIWAFVARQWGS